MTKLETFTGKKLMSIMRSLVTGRYDFDFLISHRFHVNQKWLSPFADLQDFFYAFNNLLRNKIHLK